MQVQVAPPFHAIDSSQQLVDMHNKKRMVLPPLNCACVCVLLSKFARQCLYVCVVFIIRSLKLFWFVQVGIDHLKN